VLRILGNKNMLLRLAVSAYPVSGLFVSVATIALPPVGRLEVLHTIKTRPYINPFRFHLLSRRSRISRALSQAWGQVVENNHFLPSCRHVRQASTKRSAPVCVSRIASPAPPREKGQGLRPVRPPLAAQKLWLQVSWLSCARSSKTGRRGCWPSPLAGLR
jgi:hypothetical protein